MSEFLLEIITPEKQFYKGNAEAVTCQTDGGEIGVLKGHQSMIAALPVGEIKVKLDGEWRYIFNSEGFMEVRPDEVVIFVQSCEWPENIDRARAERAKKRAEEKLRHEGSIQEQKHTQISLARAMTRLKMTDKIE